MIPRIVEVKHVKNHRLEICFSDGTVGTLDFESPRPGTRRCFFTVGKRRVLQASNRKP